MKLKITLLILLLQYFAKAAFAQSATDFTVNDCAGNSHSLFVELNAGKVIVLCWVMPCSNCVGGAVAAHNAVQSFQASNPNRVFMYLADDYANTNCASLNSWATATGLTNATTFSNAAINMSHYGTPGMPKVVVIGGANHAVFYNANNSSISQTALQNAIAAALAAPTGIKESLDAFSEVKISPNPAAAQATIAFTLKQPAEVTAEIYNAQGQKVSTAFSGQAPAGENQVKVSTDHLANGLYFVNLAASGKSRIFKLAVSR